MAFPTFLPYQTFQEFNQTGVEGLFTYPAHIVPIFIPLVLFMIFSIVMLSTYFSQRRIGRGGDFFASLAVAGFFTAVIAFLMTLIEGLINLFTLVITVSVAIITVILLLILRDRD